MSLSRQERLDLLYLECQKELPSTEIVRTLIQGDPDVCLETDEDGDTLLHLLCGYYNGSLFPLLPIVVLLACPDAAKVRSDVGALPIHYAMIDEGTSTPSISKHLVVNLALAYPQSLSMVDVTGRTPLHYAVRYSQKSPVLLDIVYELLQSGIPSFAASHLIADVTGRVPALWLSTPEAGESLSVVPSLLLSAMRVASLSLRDLAAHPLGLLPTPMAGKLIRAPDPGQLVAAITLQDPLQHMLREDETLQKNLQCLMALREAWPYDDDESLLQSRRCQDVYPIETLKDALFVMAAVTESFVHADDCTFLLVRARPMLFVDGYRDALANT